MGGAFWMLPLVVWACDETSDAPEPPTVADPAPGDPSDETEPTGRDYSCESRADGGCVCSATCGERIHRLECDGNECTCLTDGEVDVSFTQAASCDVSRVETCLDVLSIMSGCPVSYPCEGCD